jgi:hypothetical protein
LRGAKRRSNPDILLSSGLVRFARNGDYLGNRAAFSSSARASPFARYDTVR